MSTVMLNINLMTLSPWLTISTLNNRMLVINVLKVKRIQLLDENASNPDDDWELDWDSYQGYPPEIYRALANWALGDIEIASESYSQEFNKAIKDIIETEKLDADSIENKIINTMVHYCDGSLQSIHVQEECLWSIVSNLGYDEPHVFNLSNADMELERFIPANAICMIDMPLYQVMDTAKLELRKQ